jgi:hypothetical protein
MEVVEIAIVILFGGLSLFTAKGRRSDAHLAEIA